MSRIERGPPFIAVLGYLFMAVPSLSLAQSTGTLRGVVTALDGAPLAGVTIVVSSSSQAVKGRATVTDTTGHFNVLSLPPAGDYEVRTSFPDLATVVYTAVVVAPDRRATLTITMQPETSLQEKVQVRAKPDIIDLENTTTETRFSSEFIEALPVLGRNYQDVLKLAPGVSDIDGDGNPNIHGARDTDVGTRVDGISTADPLTGKAGAQLNIESIQEIEVKTTGATAEYGRAQGGFANIITKSGGNDFEGTFKVFWRGSALDGDGAGTSDPLLHGGLGDNGARDLTFNDFLPFLALSGPIVRDRAWYFLALEYIQTEKPVNALSTSFVTGVKEHRDFAKFTFQAGVNHRIVLSANYDPQQLLNEGLSSFTPQETGFTLESGGLLLSLREVSVLSPTVVLETAVASFEGEPDLIPNLGLDINGNGLLYSDRNGNGLMEASERDAGEDFDLDGAFDVWEDTLIADGLLSTDTQRTCIDLDGTIFIITRDTCRSLGAGINRDATWTLDEDGFRHELEHPFHPNGDGDRRLTPQNGCEGELREDRDCDGILDINEDEYWCKIRGSFDPRCNNGRLDSSEDADGNGKLDTAEDRNGNGKLDDTPFPGSLYPYGRLRPLPRDRDYTVDQIGGVVSGPYFKVFHDNRRRYSLRQDLTTFVPDFHGVHDIKLGYLLERERFERTTEARDIIGLKDPGYLTGSIEYQLLHPDLDFACNPYEEACLDPGVGRVIALLPTSRTLDQSADGSSVGFYVQDTYKPRPNLSIGLGIRYDREVADSSGYTFFDPTVERKESDRLMAFAGGEQSGNELLHGNGDGVRSRGILSDPIVILDDGSLRTEFAEIVDRLQRVSIGRLTRHRGEFDATLNELEALFPDLFSDGTLDQDELASLGINLQQPERFRITNDNLAPRLSISWDPWSDGRTKLFATWGRYYDKLFLNTVVGEQDIERVARYYVYDRSGVGAYLRDDRVLSDGVPTHNVGASLSRSPPTIAQIDRNLATPFSDELTIGLERELAPELAIAIRYIDRTFQDQLQDVDLNHQLRTDPTTGQPSDLFGNLTEVEQFPDDPNPLTLPTRDGRPDLFINNFFFNQVLRVGNYNESSYKAFEIELSKRLSRRWEMNGSYAYSRAFGDAEDFQSSLGNDPSTIESEYGPLDFDQRHVVKLNASIFLQRDWQLGVAASWSSGLPYSVISRFFAADNLGYQQFRTRFGFTDTVPDAQGDPVRVFKPLSRNSERNNAFYDFNVRAKKSLVIGRTTAALFVEVFNLLNSDDLHIVTFQPNSGGSDPGAGGIGAAGTHLQLDATRRFGRRYQVGIQVSF